MQLAETEFKFIFFCSVSSKKSFLIITFLVAASISPGITSVKVADTYSLEVIFFSNGFAEPGLDFADKLD